MLVRKFMKQAGRHTVEPVIGGRVDPTVKLQYDPQLKQAKEAIPEILTWLASQPNQTVDDAIPALNLGGITREQLAVIIDKIVKENQSMVTERKERAVGPLMGLVMKQVRGRVDGKIVSELLNTAIQKHLK